MTRLEAEPQTADAGPRVAHVRETRVVVDFSYPVVFTADAFDPQNPTLAQIVSRAGEGQRHRVLVLLDSGLASAQPQLAQRIGAYAEAWRSVLELVGDILPVPGGEAAKNGPAALEAVQRALAEHRIDRHSFCLALGGGAVLDTVGYAAATVHRGVRLLRMPSTVLAQNDAGVGVKNGINAFGQKNFLGTFAPPFAVINDASLLTSLSARDAFAGIAEAVKVALIRDASFFDWLWDNKEALAAREADATAFMVRRGAELHLEHIEGGGDPFERGSARPLDYGHWAAHKLERLTSSALRHGEAVAIGLALDTLYSAARGWLDTEQAERVLLLLSALNLPIYHPELSRRASDGRLVVEEGLAEFREHLGGRLTLTFLDAIGVPRTEHDVDLEHLYRCVERLEAAEAGSAA